MSIWSFKQMRDGNVIDQASAERIASALGEKYDQLFELQRDMTPLKPGTIHTYHRILSASYTGP